MEKELLAELRYLVTLLEAMNKSLLEDGHDQIAYKWFGYNLETLDTARRLLHDETRS